MQLNYDRHKHQYNLRKLKLLNQHAFNLKCRCYIGCYSILFYAYVWMLFQREYVEATNPSFHVNVKNHCGFYEHSA